MQRGSICTGGTTCGNDRNLLDFIDMTIDDHGRIEVGYADGCISACVTDPSQNGHNAYATIARQSGGMTLFSAYDPATTNLTLSSLDVTSSSNGTFTATMLVKNTGTTPVSGAQTQVLDGRKQVGLTPPVDLAAGQARTLDRDVEAVRLDVAHRHRGDRPEERSRRGRRVRQQARRETIAR